MINYSAPGAAGFTAGGTVRVPNRYTRPQKLWQTSAQLANVLSTTNARLDSAANRLDHVARALAFSLHLHPFKIYQLPLGFRTTPDPTTDWRKYRVRGGSVFLDDAIGYPATNTDGHNLDVDSSSVSEDDCTDILIPNITAWSLETSLYYFWLEIEFASDTWSVTLRSGSDPATLNETSNPKPWTTFPASDPHRILIGLLSWQDQAAVNSHLPDVRQFVRTDLHFPIAMSVCEGGSQTSYFLPAISKSAIAT